MKPYENKWKFVKEPYFKDDNQTSKKAVRQHAKKELANELTLDEYYNLPWWEIPWDFEDYQEIEKD